MKKTTTSYEKGLKEDLVDPVEAAEYRAIERMTIKTAKMFERNWLARNKMSRLKDNMKIFTAGQRELAKLGKK